MPGAVSGAVGSYKSLLESRVSYGAPNTQLSSIKGSACCPGSLDPSVVLSVL